ncbi:MAG: vWA domain-containing protein [Myxococcaceae bacterium]
MFVGFLYELRRRKVPVGAQEALVRALETGLHDSSLEGFYDVARALCVHTEVHLDAFDQAFLAHFKGIEEKGQALAGELLEWLQQAADKPPRERSAEESAALDALDAATLQALFEQRMREQRERHDEGNRWIGTRGTSPFGNAGKAAAPVGFRIEGEGGGRSALKTADARLYRGYRDDQVLDTRALGMALRKLRAFTREGAPDELDLEGTIDATARNAGELEVVLRPPRRPDTRVLLLLDVGGSMTPHSHTVDRLFSAAKQATHFKELRTYYFHNCVYGRVYRTERFSDPIPVPTLLADCGPHWKLVVVGDALMAPYELMLRSSGTDLFDEQGPEGIVWLMRLAEHFQRHVWLNPEPQSAWWAQTVRTIRKVFPMFTLTLGGLGEAVTHLVRRGAARV